MKRILIIIIVALSLKATAQKPNVFVNANIKGIKFGDWVYYRTLGGEMKDSVKTVQNGFRFKLNIPAGEGNIYLLQIGKGYQDNNTSLVYLDKGTVNIKGKGPGFKDAKLSGTSSVKDWNTYNDFTQKDPRVNDADSFYKKANELYSKHDSLGLKALEPKLNYLDSVKTELSKQWVNEHLNSPISAFVLSFVLKYKLKMEETEAIMNKISASAKNNIPAKKVLHSIEVDKLTGMGRTAMDFTQTDTLGKPVSLKDFRGKYVLVDFWASWCVPCRGENPNVVKAFASYKSKNFTVLGVSLDNPGKKDAWLKAIHDDGLTWTHVSDLKGWSNAVAKQYDINSIPSNLLIDPEGKIVAKDLHGEELEKKLSELLGSN
ncbi:MAG: AhpC/TSA family protein [Bacteroidetes bacterium]|nr:AhpC/TSA family protein [Bacteroidota bacterium]MBS1929651.1 AhpC/TSA family protein [Bacteroidota bacterium]